MNVDIMEKKEDIVDCVSATLEDCFAKDAGASAQRRKRKRRRPYVAKSPPTVASTEALGTSVSPDTQGARVASCVASFGGRGSSGGAGDGTSFGCALGNVAGGEHGDAHRCRLGLGEPPVSLFKFRAMQEELKLRCHQEDFCTR